MRCSETLSGGDVMICLDLRVQEINLGQGDLREALATHSSPALCQTSLTHSSVAPECRAPEDGADVPDPNVDKT
jgi:hypothetical protein